MTSPAAPATTSRDRGDGPPGVLSIDNTAVQRDHLGVDIAFEWAFPLPDVEDLADSRLDRLADQVDAVCTSHANLTVATVLVEGLTALQAGIAAANALRSCALNPTRSYPDLVTVTDIAERASVTRQAVAHWVRGVRHDNSFPPPVNLVSGGVWLWHDVDSWLKEHVTDIVSDEVAYPTLEDHARLDTSLLAEEVPHLTWWPGIAAREPMPAVRPGLSAIYSTAALRASSLPGAHDRWNRLRLLADWQLSNSSDKIALAIDEFIAALEDDQR